MHPLHPLRRSHRPSTLLAAFLLALSASPHAATLHGEVVALSDGDTLTVLDAHRQQHKIRLSGIDAPEKRQPYGDRSRQSLAALVFRRSVQVEWKKKDRYGRIVGKVIVNGDDVGLSQIRNGLAWHYKAYERDQLPADRHRYAVAEQAARVARLGLWQDTDPTPPWSFRRPH